MNLKLNLTKLIQLALPQVRGSDERMLLRQWLERNTYGDHIEQQLVDIDLSQILVVDEDDPNDSPRPLGEGSGVRACPRCHSDDIDVTNWYDDDTTPDRYQCDSCGFTWDIPPFPGDRRLPSPSGRGVGGEGRQPSSLPGETP